MDDKYFLTDSLVSEKNISAMYNTYAGECVNPTLKKTFIDILKQEHILQTDIFNQLCAMGLYSITQADDKKIAQAKAKFENIKIGH